ncbi:MAG: hypothetical protein DRI90_07840, partial [Deltaproteobacteria bacterium]
MVNPILLSVITVHLDDCDGLGRTLDSLTSLLKSNQVQWLVVDGESDARLESHRAILKSVQDQADVFISEPDGGTYDAMNKGTGEALGEYVLYLNAGDQLHPHFDLPAISAELSEKSPVMLWGSYDESGKPNGAQNIAPRPPAWLW